MSGGYRPLPEDDLARLVQDIDKIRSDIRQLQMPTGTQIFEATAKLEQALSEIGTYVDAYLSSGFTTGSMTATGNVQVNGTLTATTGINSIGAYNNNLTGVGGFRVAYWGVNGAAGYVPSSLRFKQDIHPAEVDTAALLEVQPVRYRYRDAVANFGDDAPFDVGVIAEQVDELGLDWLIDYEADESGQVRPLGFKYDRLPIALLAVVKEQEARLAALEERLATHPLGSHFADDGTLCDCPQAQTGTP